MSPLGIILVIILVAVLLGGIGPWSSHFGGGGIGVLGILLIVVVVLLLTGRI